MRTEYTAKLKVELDAAADYYERTGKNYWYQEPVEQRKIVESYMEDHVYDQGGEFLS